MDFVTLDTVVTEFSINRIKLENSNIYFNDIYSQRVFKTSLLKDSIDVLLDPGKGPGPSEISFCEDFYIDDNEVAVVDRDQNSLKTFDKNSTLARYQKLQNVDRAISLDNNKFVFINSSEVNGIDFSCFDLYDSTFVFRDKDIAGLGNIENGQLLHDGFFATNGKVIIFASYQANYFYAIDVAGKLLFKANYIYNTPAGVVTKIDNMSFVENGTITLSDLYVDEHIYVMTTFRKKSLNNRKVIDVYNLDNGKYKFSCVAPKYKGEDPEYFSISDGKALFVYEGDILITGINEM